MARLWLVRAGRNGEREQAALTESVLAPGFLEVKSLANAKTRDEIAALLAAAYSTDGPKRIGNFAAQLNQFRNIMETGDFVVMPRKLTPTIAIGTVSGGYDWHPSLAHVRKVAWKKSDIPREVFKQDLLYSFGAFMTICEVSRNEALKRVQAILKDERDPGPTLGATGKVTKTTVEESVSAEEAGIDIEELANQQMAALIKSEFAGHGLADVVNEILKAQGFTTRLSPPGPDGGRDILAVDGPLGLGKQRLCVQVKSGAAAADHAVVMSLLGAMSDAKAEHGLLVSMGGVTGPAQKKLDDSFFSVRLWQMPDLLLAIQNAYPSLPDEIRAKLPLKQIWIAVPESDE